MNPLYRAPSQAPLPPTSPLRLGLAAGALLAGCALGCGAQAESLCTWEAAGTRYGVNPQVLYAIATQESSLNPGAVHKNADGSYDYGLAQINSSWLPHLRKFGITPVQLMNPCVNMHVGAYILSISMRRHGNTWQAVGGYHSNTPIHRDRYARSIYQRLSMRGLVPKNPAQ